MDRLRINQLAYDAKRGMTPVLDDYEKRELIEAAEKLDDIENGFAVQDTLHDVREYVLDFPVDDIERVLKTAYATIEGNLDELPECFVSAFTICLDKIKKHTKEINEAADEIIDLIDGE